VWNFVGGWFENTQGVVWMEMQANYRREYREETRNADFVEIQATDGSGIGFRLYDSECHWKTPATKGWVFRAKGHWRGS
jgi:hypothetical protein